MSDRADRSVLLTESDVAAFTENGWLTIQQVSTAAELARIGEIYDDLFASRARGAESWDLASVDGTDGPELLPQIMDPQRLVPELAGTRFYASARQIATTLLGVPAAELEHFSHLILKPARYGHETPWHQDEAYWDPRYDHRGLSVWMPLEDASVAGGCMQFFSGSHRDPVRRHHHINHDPRVHGLVTDEVDASQAVACPVPAGGATVHHCRTLHYAGPNLTGAPRRAYIHVFSAPPRRREQPYPRPWLDLSRFEPPAQPAPPARSAEAAS